MTAQVDNLNNPTNLVELVTGSVMNVSNLLTNVPSVEETDLLMKIVLAQQVITKPVDKIVLNVAINVTLVKTLLHNVLVVLVTEKDSTLVTAQMVTIMSIM